MDKVRKFFIVNLGWKIISLILAVMTWFLVTNINNPVITKTVRVSLDLVNENYIYDKNLMLLNKDEVEKSTIDIKIKGSRDDISEIDVNSDLSAYIDFKPIDITTNENIGIDTSVSVYVKSLDSKYEVLDYTPKTINVIFDKLSTDEFNINVIKTGTLESGYISAEEPILDENIVKVSGAQSNIEKINSVVVEVSYDDVNSDFKTTADVVVYDIDGSVINDLFESIEPSQTDISFKVYKKKSIPVSAPTWTGIVSRGYILSTPGKVMPENIEVYGTIEDLEKLDNINLTPVNVSGVSDKVIVTYDVNEILEGSGLHIQEGSEDTITVTFDVESKVRKKLTIPISNIEIKNEPDNYEIISSFDIEIEGISDVIENISPEDIKGTLDLSNLELGENKVNVNLSLPSKVSILNSEGISVVLYEDSNSTELEPSEELIESSNNEETLITEEPLITENIEEISNSEETKDESLISTEESTID